MSDDDFLIILDEEGARRGEFTQSLSRSDFDHWAAQWAAQSLSVTEYVAVGLQIYGVEALVRAVKGNGVALPIIPMSQRDLRWRSDKLGFSSRTIGSDGCALTSMAMIATQHDPLMTPAILNTLLKNVAGFSGGDLIWQNVPQAIPYVRFIARRDWDKSLSSDDLLYIKGMLIQYGPQIMEVDFNPATAVQEQHFVVALHYDNGDIRILDPWDAREYDLLAHYAKSGHTLKRAVWGLRVFEVLDV